MNKKTQPTSGYKYKSRFGWSSGVIFGAGSSGNGAFGKKGRSRG
jgi:hypothetical protein